MSLSPSDHSLQMSHEAHIQADGSGQAKYSQRLTEEDSEIFQAIQFEVVCFIAIDKCHKSTAGSNKSLCNLCILHSACVEIKAREQVADSSQNLHVPLHELLLCWSNQKTWQKQLKEGAISFGSQS